MNEPSDSRSDILSKLLPGGRGVWIPMDHGLSGYPETGLDRMDSVIDFAIKGRADAIVLQKGVLTHQYQRTSWNKFVCHLSASTVHGGPNSQSKVTVGDVEEVISRGAVAVSTQVNLGDDAEPEMLYDMGRITSDSWNHGVPTLGMVYPRGPNLILDPEDETKGIAHAARVAFELGCDVVKVPWTGSVESFRKVTSGVPIPILIAGGTSSSFSDTLEIVSQSIIAGGSGVCMGRQIFGSENPLNRLLALRSIIHGDLGLNEALRILNAEDIEEFLV
ncbi:MAG: fructose-bisphosphate aldolase [Candidatus Thermoplasmatota archaeon]|nr:fructose-bisphosphate aldolase [Candidatus Thermoplasmatota archaeon]MEC7390620.1 fructose-bisphosphate aldolase [Candidatus Thermoplasmatota archaeon]MEC7462729.1 fructose-bisphosphate aldolase [Candidatus Thermoplasmatota archaeon]MEC7545126.1 fructose-bisphosphate aldolase [Candidatus Thermoplasmatota archaeon]MEC7601227.1 fructose-bisphosphate aldolase [Candidatus Thermoplasmatota archaeon]